MPDKIQQARAVIEALGIAFCKACDQRIHASENDRSCTGWCWICAETRFAEYKQLQGAVQSRNSKYVSKYAAKEREAREAFRVRTVRAGD